MTLRSKIFAAAAGIPILTMAAGGHGIEQANLDSNANPREDFYQYACGGWMKSNPLTPEYSRFGMFDLLRENAKTQLHDLIVGLKENPDSKKRGTNAQKVSDLYEMGMDSVRLNREGAAPLKPYLEHIASADVTTPEGLAKTLAWMHSGLSASFFSTGVGADAKNSDMNILQIGETGLGLGDRDYYLEDSENNRRIMQAYKDYIVKIMKLAGYSDSDAMRVRDNVIELETEFARNKKTREERRNPQLRYNMMTLDEICAEYPNFDWKTYFKERGLNNVERANVSAVKFFNALDKMLPGLTAQQIKDYIAYEAVSESANLLSDDFYNANFELYDRTMSGVEEQEPRWKRAMGIPNSTFGEAVGQLYVEKYFPEENKAYMKNLVANLRTALGKHIDNLTWMSDATKQRAHEKLDGIIVKIGYPDKWKDYSAIDIDPEKSYLDNVLAAAQWFIADNLSKMGKAVDKTEWHMTPQTVNAYYSPISNEICFPAGILQAPYFDAAADDAQNYGAIGVVIGHELTHGFDDQGRQYDKDGNLNDWWQPADAEAFTKLADALAAQFDAVEVAPGVNANGRFTLGENIADQGGLRVALTAYLDSPEGQQAKVIDGFDPLQRFYLAYANVWACNIRPEEVLNRVKTDPHSLGEHRVNVSLRNVAPFFDAFGIKEGDKMFRPEAERVIIW